MFVIIKNLRKEELTDQTLDAFQWKMTHLNYKQMKQIEIGFERFLNII